MGTTTNIKNNRPPTGEAESSPSHRPPGALSLTAATYVFAVVMMGTTLPTPLYPDYERTYDFASLTTTVLFAMYAIGVIVSLILFGQVSARLGRRPVLAAGVALAFVSSLLFLFAGDMWQLYLGRVISGLSAGIFTATGTAAVMENAPAGRKNLASALSTAANIGGLGLGILVSGLIAAWTPWPLHAPFAVHGILLIVGGLALLAVRETVEPDRTRHILGVPGIPRPARRVFAAASAGAVAGFMMCGIYTSVAPGFMTSVLSVSSPAVIGLVLCLVFGASAAAQIGLRRLADRTLILGGSVAMVVGMALLATSLATASLPLLVASAVLGGAGQGLMFMTGMRAVMELTPADQRTRATTSYFIVAYLAISGPPVGAGIVSTFVDLSTTGLVAAAVIAVVAVLALSQAGQFRRTRA